MEFLCWRRERRCRAGDARARARSLACAAPCRAVRWCACSAAPPASRPLHLQRSNNFSPWARTRTGDFARRGFARAGSSFYALADTCADTDEMPATRSLRSRPVRCSELVRSNGVGFLRAPRNLVLHGPVRASSSADAACPPMCTLVINRIVNSRSPSCWHTLSLLGSAMRTESAHAHADGLHHRMLTASLKA